MNNSIPHCTLCGNDGGSQESANILINGAKCSLCKKWLCQFCVQYTAEGNLYSAPIVCHVCRPKKYDYNKECLICKLAGTESAARAPEERVPVGRTVRSAGENCSVCEQWICASCADHEAVSTDAETGEPICRSCAASETKLGADNKETR
jgi:hypothetical protein